MICQHLGPDTGDTTAVDLCCGNGEQVVYQCNARHCKTVVAGRPYDQAIGTCQACPVRQQAATFPVLEPLAYKEIGLPAKARQEGAYNCSLHLDDKPGFAFAYRAKWTGSDIRLGRLNNAYQASGKLMPTLTMHPRAIRGREDPRLFRFRGEWYFSFTGYESKEYFSSVLYAKVGQWPFVTSVTYPIYSRRNHAEKNWGFFDHDGELYAVYAIGPGEHRVLKIDGERVAAEYSTEWNPAWSWGVMRGGASPVRVGDEYYSWFHGVRIEPGLRHYTVGLYTFEAKPPFRTKRLVTEPMAIAGYSRWADKEAKYIIFPCGAALKGGIWHISAGEHDNRCTAISFDAAAVESKLEPVRRSLFHQGELGEILSLAGWCDEAKSIRISDLVATIPERVNGVEIGVFAGRSLFPAAVGARSNPHGGHIIGVDSYDAEENLRGIAGEEHRKFWTQSLVDDAKEAAFATREKLGLGNHCKIVVAKSGDVADTVDNGLNYLHIDGNHSSEGAVLDAWLYLPKVSIGGLVLVDDTTPGDKNAFADGVMCAVSIVERFCELVEDRGTWRVYRKVR